MAAAKKNLCNVKFVNKIMSSNYDMELNSFIEASFTSNITTRRKGFEGLRDVSFQTEYKNL